MSTSTPAREAVVIAAPPDRSPTGPVRPWLVFDDRWVADHGIGRVAREWGRLGAGWQLLGPGPSPASPADPIWLAARLRDAGLPFFSPGYNAPLASRSPFFMTVHDLCCIDLARLTGALRRVYYGTVVRQRCHAAHGVFTVSEFSRGRLIDAWGLDPGRVHVVTPGVSQAFVRRGPAARFSRPYVLGAGNASPHKNETRTVAAFIASGLPRTHDLVLTGAPRAVSSGPLDASVRFTGRVDDASLAALYRGADALVFASLYKGILGHLNRRVRAAAAWCPSPGRIAAAPYVLAFAASVRRLTTVLSAYPRPPMYAQAHGMSKSAPVREAVANEAPSERSRTGPLRPGPASRAVTRTVAAFIASGLSRTRDLALNGAQRAVSERSARCVGAPQRGSIPWAGVSR